MLLNLQGQRTNKKELLSYSLTAQTGHHKYLVHIQRIIREARKEKEIKGETIGDKTDENGGQTWCL